MSSANSPNEIDHAAINEPPNVGTRSRPRSSIGALDIRSTARKTASRIALAESVPMTQPEPQPSRWLSIRPNTRARGRR